MGSTWSVPSSEASICPFLWLRPRIPAHRGPASTGPSPGTLSTLTSRASTARPRPSTGSGPGHRVHLQPGDVAEEPGRKLRRRAGAEEAGRVGRPEVSEGPDLRGVAGRARTGPTDAGGIGIFCLRKFRLTSGCPHDS